MPRCRATGWTSRARSRVPTASVLRVRPLAAPTLLQAAGDALDAAYAAPGHLAGWSETRLMLRLALRPIPGDRAILIGAHALEQDCCAAGGLAGYLSESRYFAPA